MIAEEAIRGAIYKIAPENLRKVITKALTRGAISQIAPQTVPVAITFVREIVNKTVEISTKAWKMIIQPLPAAKNRASVITRTAGMITNQTAIIRTVPRVFIGPEFLTIAQPLMAGWIWRD